MNTTKMHERARLADEEAAKREARWRVKWDVVVKLCVSGNVNRRVKRARTVPQMRWHIDARAKRSEARMKSKMLTLGL
jgi:hypothetical protein